jgi:ESF2/ABP1 family protein
MKPVKIKHLLGRYGEIGRVYLAPEDPAAFKKRVKAGGNKKLRFTEGWVEFMDKRVAEATSELLNNTPLSEEKRGFYASDLWNIKFLPHFKWHHLTEKLTYERRIRKDKLRSELSAVRKDAEAYVEKADASRKIKKMEERKLGQGVTEQPEDPAAAAAGVEAERSRIRRQFKQHTPLADPTMVAIGGAGKQQKSKKEASS